MLKIRQIAAALLCGLLASGCLLFGQSITADLLGTVRDPSGQVVPGAAVTLTSEATGARWASVTDETGSYLFPQLKPGKYRVDVSKSGFEKESISGIELLVGQRPRVDVALRVGDVTQAVEVNAGGVQLLETETSGMGQVITGKSIVELPLNGRNFMQLAVLSTGVAPPAPNGAGSPASSFTGSTAGQVSFIVTGFRESNVSYLVNGIETRNAKFGSVGFRPSIDAIQEFKMQTSAFSAEFGRSSAVVNTTLKSGSNSIHGTAAEFLRNSRLDANDFFLNQAGRPRAPYQQNDFEVSLGGPVVLPHIYNGRNKTFFFLNYEGYRSRKAISGLALVPSRAQLAGNLADDSAGTGIFPLDSPFCQSNPASVKCVNIINPFTGTPFPGNNISSALNPIAQKWLAYIPAPNAVIQPGSAARPSFNFTASPKERNDFNQANTRIDQNIGSKDQLFGSYSFDDRPHIIPSAMPMAGKSAPLRNQLAQATEDHIFSPTLVNEVRFGYSRSRTDLLSEGAYRSNVAADVFGFKNTSTKPVDFGVPIASIPGFTTVGTGAANPNAATDENYQFVDNVTLTRNSHTLQLGFNFIRTHYYSFVNFTSMTSSAFDGRFTGASLADFLMGLPVRSTVSVGDGSENLRSSYVAGFVQDAWRIRPNLTINLGLRYEFQQTPWELNNRTAWFDPSLGTIAYSMDGKVRNGITNPDYNNFAPRLGFAYSPTGLHNTVIRGAFGVFYATDNWNELQFMVQQPRFTATQTLDSDPVKPTLSLANLFPVGQLTGGTASPFSLDATNRTPYVEEWSLDVQHTFGKDWLLDVGYMGNVGQKLPQRRNENTGATDPTGTIPLSARVPYPAYSWILLSYNGGWSSYNGMAVRVEKQFSNGLTLLGSYTWSHALDLGTTDEFSATSNNFKAMDKGSTLADVRHRFVGSYDYELPFGRGKHWLSTLTGPGQLLLGGWKVNGITTFSTGQPRTPGLPFDWINTGLFNGSRPNRIGNPVPANRSYNNWMDINAYVVPGCPSYVRCAQGVHVEGNAARGSIRMPGLNNWDLSILKDTHVTESMLLQFRSEFFNVWNHTQFGDAFLNLTAGQFGRITSVRVPPREIQFGLKLIF